MNAHKFYLEYVNDYLTIEKIAEHKQITIKKATSLVNEGRNYNDFIHEWEKMHSLSPVPSFSSWKKDYKN